MASFADRMNAQLEAFAIAKRIGLDTTALDTPEFKIAWKHLVALAKITIRQRGED